MSFEPVDAQTKQAANRAIKRTLDTVCAVCHHKLRQHHEGKCDGCPCPYFSPVKP